MAKYIVIGKYDSERNSWIPDGDIRHVVSRHHSEPRAWAEAHLAHKDLGGCEGSDSLTKVMRLAPAGYEPSEDEDTYMDGDTLYVACDFWQAHVISHNGFGFIATPKK